LVTTSATASPTLADCDAADHATVLQPAPAARWIWTSLRGTVPPDYRGKFLAFTLGDTDGMRHLKALASAGITDVHLLGDRYPGARFSEMLYLVNVDVEPHTLPFDGERDKRCVLHPVHRASGATDRRAAEQAGYDAANGRFIVPARTAVLFVLE
jgi:hypothetical protein